MSHPAIFFDRDGTLIVEKKYLHKAEDVEIYPGSGAALKRAQDAGFKLVMVTNQSGVGRGYYPMSDVEKVHAFIAGELARDGVTISKVYVAPEAPDMPSRARKPSPAFLFDARDELGIDLGRSYMIGDKLIDLECGWNAGVRRSILVRCGYGLQCEQEEGGKLRDAILVDTFRDAVVWVLEQR